MCGSFQKDEPNKKTCLYIMFCLRNFLRPYFNISDSGQSLDRKRLYTYLGFTKSQDVPGNLTVRLFLADAGITCWFWEKIRMASLS